MKIGQKHRKKDFLIYLLGLKKLNGLKGDTSVPGKSIY